MPSFSSLPQELVDYIVELATPPFQLYHWKERMSTLKALCSTSKALRQAAHPALYHSVVLQTDSSIQRLAADPFEPGVLRSLSPFEHVTFLRKEAWDMNNVDAETRSSLSALLRRNKLKQVSVDGGFTPAFADLQSASSIWLDGWQELVYESSRFIQPHHRFHTLRRLGLFNLQIAGHPMPITSDVFPALVSLDLYEACYIDPNGARTYLSLQSTVIELAPRIRAAALGGVDELDANELTVEVLDLYQCPVDHSEISRIPATVKILRLNHTDHDELQTLLASPCFPPMLNRIYATARLSQREASTLKESYTRRGVDFVYEGQSVNEPGLQGEFFDFLDNLKDRFGLDV